MPRPRRKDSSQALRVVPLGGLGEIGKNCTALQYGNDVVLVDAGVMFPEEELYGVDLVIPDFGFLRRSGRRLLGVFLTHGHEDHVGSLSFLLREFRVPVYGTPLTVGLVRNKVRDGDLHAVKPRQRVRLGPFEAEWVRVAHSVPDSCSVAVRTPAGTVVVSGDFKFDQTPVDGRPTDVARLAELGEEGVLALLLDSTNVERPGITPSERVVGDRFVELFSHAPGRVLLTTFASNVHRIQQAFDAAVRTGRRVAAVGRSMVEVIRAASELGYLKIPRGAYVSVEEASRLADRKVLLLVTGSQGEPLSALTRISTGSHKQVRLKKGDTVVFSASPIPGNEGMVARTINHLFKHGAEVVYGPTSGAHVSGHGSQEELRLMIHLLRPRYVVPVHGEYRHLVLNARLAHSVGVPTDRVLVGENGSVFEFRNGEGRVAGHEEVGNVLVDGLGVGDVGAVVLRDRQHLARDGVLIVLVALDRQTGRWVQGPEVISRGFVYQRGSEELIEAVKEQARQAVDRCRKQGQTEFGAVRSEIREQVSRFVYDRTGRQPMVLPLLVEV
jgi:ribonuclease J